MNEADTRAELIDKQLAVAGWITGGDVRVQREYNINAGEIRVGGIRAGKLKADYILSYQNRKLAVVEAKSDELDVAEGVAQAKLYAQKLRIETSYSANGKAIYQICLKRGEESLVERFLTPQELWQKTFTQKNEWIERFNAVPFEDIRGSRKTRYYQEIAVNNAMEAIANDRQRVLLTLATGTGKTFIAFQIAWKLFKSRWNIQKDGKRTPRILFLADRNILANQAYLGFGAFEDDALVRIKPGEIAKKGEVPKNGSVFFSIFQTFMSGTEGKPYFGDYEPDFFDLVIIDECHRGGANDESSWRDILNYFNSAVHLGLTATPKRCDNVDTYAYFGEPVYQYSLKEGIQDGFLTPFKITRKQSTYDEYRYTPDDTVLEGKVEEERVYKEKDFNKEIVIEERDRKRVQVLLSSIDKNEKTIVFCVDQAHAAMVRDFINQESGSAPDDYCVRVTSDEGEIGDTYLRQFQDNEKLTPTILTTSQKLTTGVDACNVRNIVLLREINSMIEFKQIIGRGTRLFEGKYYFTILDFVNAFRLFSDPEWDGEPLGSVVKDGGGGESERQGGEAGNADGEDGKTSKSMLRIKLSDGKVREYQSMSSTYFFVDGRPMDARDFIKHLFGILHLPGILGSEEKLREVWASPVTRRELLDGLEKAGCNKHDLVKLQELINAEDSDLFDVLAYTGYARTPVSRVARVAEAQGRIYTFLNKPQREFIKFVLRNYVKEGVNELDVGKLSTVLEAKYGSIHAAKQELGTEQDIQRTFVEMQQHLYNEVAS